MKDRKVIDLYSIEQELFAQGITIVCGVDEAGRGPLCGPVYAAAVILNPNDVIEGLNDSKKLTESARELAFVQIKARALAWSIASASAYEIDKMNILHATMLAMRRAVSELKITPQMALVDGDRCPYFDVKARAIVGGDGLSASIAAASILAKVERDHYMCEYAKKYPEYGFEKHKGYGTKAHTLALSEFGKTPEHRLTFLRKFI